jgi:linoleoyl-CoA desaturase
VYTVAASKRTFVRFFPIFPSDGLFVVLALLEIIVVPRVSFSFLQLKKYIGFIMGVNAPIRFVGKEKTQFYAVLCQRVDAYFQQNGLSRHADTGIVLKTIILIAAYIVPFVLMVWLQPSFAVCLGLWTIMGFAMAGIGMSVMHDANHGAYSSNSKVNTLLGYSINLLGGAGFTWKLQHNILHHTYTNIVHYDDDIEDKAILRMSPHTPVKSIQRFQWFYAIIFYSIVTLYWVTAKDFMQFARYTRMKVNKNTRRQNAVTLARITAIKIGYFLVFFGIPLAAGLPFLQILGGFLLMHAIGGIVLTVIFQLAHTVEETTHPVPNAEGNIENEWAIHQMNTTVNFSRYNRFISWYVGGLNFQVEHHLFPKICHTHYPNLANIVERTAQEFNIPYLEHKSFGHALRSHFVTLQRFGKMPDLDEVLG